MVSLEPVQLADSELAVIMRDRKLLSQRNQRLNFESIYTDLTPMVLAKDSPTTIYFKLEIWKVSKVSYIPNSTEQTIQIK